MDRLRGGLTAGAVLAASLLLAAPAHAGTIGATTTFDELDGAPDATCSLREAVQTANTDGDVGGCTDQNSAVEPDTIVLGGGEYDLTIAGVENSNAQGDLDVSESLNIQGAGSEATGIDGNGAFTNDRVLDARDSGTVLGLSGLTVHDGATSDVGGGIYVATLNLANSAVRGNTGGIGGGIFAGFLVTMVNSTVSGNDSGSSGGGISAGPITLTDSTVSDNHSAGDGGGISAAGAALVNTTVSGNEADSNGGGIKDHTTPTLTDSTVSGNAAGVSGGGIFSVGTSTLTGSTVSGNTAAASGGGVFGPSTITDSTVSRNEADGGGGGGVSTATGNLTVLRSTIHGNDSVDDGGGVFFTSSGAFTATNSTLSGNSANDNGGGILTDEGTTNLRNATITRNVADADSMGAQGNGGGLLAVPLSPAAINLRNTILAGNAALTGGAPDCVGTLNSENYNLIGSATGCTITGATGGNQAGDPKLELLSGNGGPTLTHGWMSDSPARNAGNPAAPGSGGTACEATDQRGLSRGGANGVCDIGAVEGGAGVGAGNFIVVTTSFDQLDGAAPCSLREAVRFANDDITTGGCTQAAGNVVGDADTIVLRGEHDLTIPGAGENANATGDLDVTDDLTIQGNSAGLRGTGIDGNGLDRVLHSTAGQLTLDSVTVHDGATSASGGGILGAVNLNFVTVTGNTAAEGGGISGAATLANSTVSENESGGIGGGIQASTATLTNSTVTGNEASGGGGGIYASTATLTNSSVSGNTGGGVAGCGPTLTDTRVGGNTGGGVMSFSGCTAVLLRTVVTDNERGTDGGGLVGPGGSFNLTDSTVARNEAGGDGGGMAIAGALSSTVIRSTILGNDSVDDGGGIFFNTPGTLTVTNSTVSGNSAQSDGGGINTGDGTANLRNATITRNVADGDAAGGGTGGGVVSSAGTDAFNLANTILSGNFDLSGPGGPDCVTSAAITSQGYNLVGSAGQCAGLVYQPTDIHPQADPGLAFLGANGGATLTHSLFDASLALNTGNPAAPGSGGSACEATDQRGLPRGADPCDIGAFERQPNPPDNPVTPFIPGTGTIPASPGAATPTAKKCRKAKKKGKAAASAGCKKKPKKK